MTDLATQIDHVGVRIIERKHDAVACINLLHHFLLQVLQQAISQHHKLECLQVTCQSSTLMISRSCASSVAAVLRQQNCQVTKAVKIRSNHSNRNAH